MNLREADLQKFGEQLYHHFRKQGNHRWDTSVHRKEDGSFYIVFRHSFSKKNSEGVKKTQIRDEKVIHTKNESQLISAALPEFPDSEILRNSDFFKGLREG
ncbi:antirestriction protein ArdR [Pantoea agglomerans]|uniref:antirestriction protein ArdR n=1 Tax=Enterobacter agglomerans TaxID=549 RepID=UPI003C7D3244